MKPTKAPATDLTVFYDGACPLCIAEIAFYRRQKGAEAMTFIDVADAQNPLPKGVSRTCALARFHVETADGQVIDGAGAFLALLQRLPRFRWLGRAADRPLLRPVLSLLYDAFLRLRPAIVRLYCRIARVGDV
ncbi:MAG TPA: DUF393 domain-containing protein [Rhodobacterales bacterium]|nr:DUF393 domain-containing protein [Rhodobacterales bacterium]